MNANNKKQTNCDDIQIVIPDNAGKGRIDVMHGGVRNNNIKTTFGK